MAREHGGDLGELEERKIEEIVHSKRRRELLQGFERHVDVKRIEEIVNVESLVRDDDAFRYHFANAKFYSIVHSSEEYQYSWLRERCSEGAKILDFACGSGENGIQAAKFGADCVGIDISAEGIANARLNAQQLGVADRCQFEVMDGENMTFPDNTFDVAVEYGALHHVELNRAMAELCRVLKPGAEMICVEALRHNPVIHWYRRRTPHLRTRWETDHILRVQDLDVVRKYFTVVSVKFFHLAVLAAVPFRRTLLFEPLRVFLDAIDRLLLGHELVGKYGWIMVFVIKKKAAMTTG